MDRFALIPIPLALVMLGCSGDEVEAEDGQLPHEPIPCETSADCPPNYFCSSGGCYYNSKPGHDGCDDPSWCPVGSFCDGYDCIDYPPIEACELELSWTEARTRAVFHQGFERFEAHDLDGDGAQELLSWSAGGLQVLAAGELRTPAYLPTALLNIESRLFIDLDDDGELDLLVREHEGATWIAFGQAGVAFGPWQAGPSLDLRSPIALLGGLLAEPFQVAQFGSTGSLSDLRALDIDGVGGEELFYQRYQLGKLRAAAGWHASVPTQFFRAFEFLGADLDEDGDDEIVSLERGNAVTMVNLLHGGPPQLDEAGAASFERSSFVVPEVSGEIAAPRLRAGATPTLWLMRRYAETVEPVVVHEPLGAAPCYELGPELERDPRRVLGDFDGDGLDELARIDAAGRLSLLVPR